MQRDPLAASEWVGGIEPSPAKDEAIVMIAEDIVENGGDINDALEWIEGMQSDEKRARALVKINKAEQRFR